MDDPGFVPERLLAHQFLRAEVSARWLGILDLRPGMEVADLGSGPGLVALQMAARVRPGGRVWAVDRSEAMVAHAERLAHAARLDRWVRAVAADLAAPEAEELPIPAGSLDRALAANVLHHLGDPSRFLALARRLLDPGGRLLVVEFDPDRGLDFGPPARERMAPESLEEAAARAGLGLLAGGVAGEAWYHRLFTPA
ncbi:MAG: methyltransferase domain-containing protein [Clostridia bacterium]|nr:methyltransferase domain-containing protein [Clostridia bacterium]MCL6521647.1 methyltransferase domain-containing protein [Bacillota bacterium]